MNPVDKSFSLRQALVDILRQWPWVSTRGLCLSLGDWIRYKQKRAGWYQRLRGPWIEELNPGGQIIHTPPAELKEIEKAQFRRVTVRSYPSAFMAYLPGAHLFSDQGAVITPDNHLLEQYHHRFGPVTKTRRWARRPFAFTRLYIKRIDATVALLAAPEGKNYYHWLFDCLPRLHLLEKYRPAIELYALPGGLSPVQIETLRLLDVGSHQILQLTENKRVRCEHLYAPSLPGSEGCTPPWVIQFLRDRLIPTAINTVGRGKKIYVERGGCSTRPIINEPDLIAALAAEGFIAVKPETLTFREQVALFRDAQTIVSAHGAGLANLVFSSRASVLEIFSSDYLRPDCYFSLCRQLGHSYDCWTDVASIKQNWGAITIDIPVIMGKIKGLTQDFQQ
jgi:hypothetical protein